MGPLVLCTPCSNACDDGAEAAQSLKAVFLEKTIWEDFPQDSAGRKGTPSVASHRIIFEASTRKGG